MGQPLAAWAVSEIGTKAFITGDNDVQGNEQADFFALGFEKVGGTFVDRVMTDASKIKEVLGMIHGSDAEFVFAGFKGETARAFLNAVANFFFSFETKKLLDRILSSCCPTRVLLVMGNRSVLRP